VRAQRRGGYTMRAAFPTQAAGDGPLAQALLDLATPGVDDAGRHCAALSHRITHGRRHRPQGPKWLALLSGTVRYDPEPLERPAEGNILICCSRPTDAVVIDL
jgi:hypothetical protein